MEKVSSERQHGFGKSEIAANTSLFNFVWDNLHGNSKQSPLLEEGKMNTMVLYKEPDRKLYEGHFLKDRK